MNTLSANRNSNLLMMRLFFLLFLILLSSAAFSQQALLTEDEEPQKTRTLKLEGDSRRTFVNRESAAIYGVRLGVLLNERTDVGIGIYSSNLFGILGGSVNKQYQDKNSSPPLFFNYGEYTLISTNRLKFTANSQIGFGWVDIDFVDPNVNKQRVRETKSLIEHSIKADVKTFEWLRLSGGIGYRYLIAGEEQIRNAFNAPIYIVGFSIDFKYLSNRIFKK